MNKPLTYEDFISQVKAAMPLDSPFRYANHQTWPNTHESDREENKEYRTANKDFQFKDMEIGKIYVFWNRWDTWFLSPYTITSKSYYSVYWCSYTPLDSKRSPIPIPDDESGGEDECAGWDSYVWNGQRWKVLNIPPFTHETFLNWIQPPWGEIK